MSKAFPTVALRDGNTPLPNYLLDVLMPQLKDTEWRVLCVIARQTLGWQHAGAANQRKDSDWLSHRQLKAKTGRASEALCRAIDGLVRRGLIEVSDETGQLLVTPAERRRLGERMRFRLAPDVVEPHTEARKPDRPGSSQDRDAAVATIGEKAAYLLSEKEERKTGRAVSKTEFRKAKTTKETRDNISPNGGERLSHLFHTSPSPTSPSSTSSGSSPASDSQPKPESTSARAPANPEVKRFLLAYQEASRRHTAQGEPLLISWGRDGKLVKVLLGVYAYDRLLTLLERFFANPEEWIRQRGYSIPAFYASISALLVSEKQEQERSARLRQPLVLHGIGGEQRDRDDTSKDGTAWRFTRGHGWIRVGTARNPAVVPPDALSQSLERRQLEAIPQRNLLVLRYLPAHLLIAAGSQTIEGECLLTQPQPS